MGRMGLVEGGGGNGCVLAFAGWHQIRSCFLLFWIGYFVLWQIRLPEKMPALHSSCIPQTNIYILRQARSALRDSVHTDLLNINLRIKREEENILFLLRSSYNQTFSINTILLEYFPQSSTGDKYLSIIETPLTYPKYR